MTLKDQILAAIKDEQQGIREYATIIRGLEQKLRDPKLPSYKAEDIRDIRNRIYKIFMQEKRHKEELSSILKDYS